jgi:hypothetical protein
MCCIYWFILDLLCLAPTKLHALPPAVVTCSLEIAWTMSLGTKGLLFHHWTGVWDQRPLLQKPMCHLWHVDNLNVQHTGPWVHQHRRERDQYLVFRWCNATLFSRYIMALVLNCKGCLKEISTRSEISRGSCPQIKFTIIVFQAHTAGTAIYKDSLYGNLYVIPICYVKSGI